MTEREQKRMVKENRKQLYLDTWARQKAQGITLPDFCRSYGLSFKVFNGWLALEGSRPGFAGAGTRAERSSAPSSDRPILQTVYSALRARDSGSLREPEWQMCNRQE